MGPANLLKRLARGDLANVTFRDMQKLVEAFGFRLVRVSGSHHLDARPDVREVLNLQEEGRGEALPGAAVRQSGRAVRSVTGGAVSDYHINVVWSDEDRGYIADIPDLEGCSAFGETPEQALAEVALAKTAWIEAARDTGRSVTEPPYRPALYAG